MRLNYKQIKLSKLITVKMLIVFILLSSLWVLLSNKILSVILDLSSDLTKIFIYNGWLYAVVTALIFYFLISKYNMHIYEETSIINNKKIEKHIKKWPWYLIILILLFSLGIFQIDSLYYKIQKAEYKEESENELKSISNLKVSYINNWRNERINSTEILLSNQIINNKIKEYLYNPENNEKKKELISFFNTVLRDSNYNSISLFDAKGKSAIYVASLSKNGVLIENAILEKYFRQNNKFISDFRKDNGNPDKLLIDLFVPVFDRNDYDSILIGAILIEINPDKLLFPYIREWPTNSLSAESFLLKCEEDSVSFISPPKKINNFETSSKRHIQNSELAGIYSMYVENKVVEAKDYRGKKILAAINKLPGTEWYLVTKIDQEEIYSDLLRSAKLFTILIVTVILTGGVSIILYWRKHITKHYKKQYETELEKIALSRNFEYMTKYANDIIILTDEDWNIVEINEKALSVYGYSREELLDKRIYELRADECKELFNTQLREFDKCDGIIFETVHERKDGTKFNVESSIRKMKIDGNTFYQGILRDITERKIAEIELKKAKDKAEEMNRLKSNFLMNMGHELRTPLNGILGYTDLLKDEIENIKHKEMLGMINQGGKRLARTMNSIMDLTVIESDEVKLNLKPLNLSDIVIDNINQLQELAKEKNLSITTSYEDNTYAMLDTSAINRVIFNLLYNSIIFTKEGCIKVKVGCEMINNLDYAYFKVADTGIGISENNLKIVFEPFRQVSEGISRDYEGAGLGLTITKKYTELMNGKIKVKSLIGVGSEFTVIFPKIIKDFSIAEELKKVTTQAQNIINKYDDKRILVLNGNKDILDLKSNILKCICKTDIVKSDDEALERARKDKFDIILMELGINNYERLNIAKKIRSISGYENTPILAVTDSDSTESKEKCIQEGCSFYFSKPFQFTELIKLVNQLLGNK